MKIRNVLLLLALSLSAKGQNGAINLSYVDPTIGGVGLILEPTRPAVHLPNSMVRVFPMRQDQLDDQISYFPLTITSHRHPNVFGILPVSGTANNTVWGRRLAYDNEKISPYDYSLRFEDSGNTLSFSPSARGGYFRFGFSTKQSHYLRMAVLNGEGNIDISGKRVISGTEKVLGVSVYFYAELSSDIKGVKYKKDKDKRAVLLDLGEAAKAADMRYGISFISVEQAKKNLMTEIKGWGLEPVKDHARLAWEKVLGQINVEGGTPAQRRVFYSSLYRCYERMVDISEYGKYYSAYDGKVHSSNAPFYVDNWLWDTYIALEPLHTILNPEMEQAKIRSYISMYEQSGWMPSFALVFGDNPCMTGNHAAAWMTDAWFKGLRDFDLRKAYEGLRKNSVQATLLPWKNGPATALDSFYNAHGYMPGVRPGEKETVKGVDDFERRQSVAVTLENSYDDWCLAQLAGDLKNPEDQRLFLNRAQNYRKVYRPEKGFMWPKDDKGAWIEPFDPKVGGGQGGRDYFTENNAYTYNWDVKHDLSGLFDLMGGRGPAEAKLDQLFRESIGRSKYDYWYKFPDATGLVGQYVMGNEPSFHIPYLYNYLGAPWKTQKRIRMLLDTWYNDTVFGIPGDEDGGGMTAFVVFSMMGFFPVTPGVPVYNIGSPVFSKVSIKLPNGKTFTINAAKSSATNKYIQSARLNGAEWNKPWFSHQQLIEGATLDLNMGDEPNKNWGSGADAAPPSSILYKPAMQAQLTEQ